MAPTSTQSRTRSPFRLTTTTTTPPSSTTHLKSPLPPSPSSPLSPRSPVVSFRSPSLPRSHSSRSSRRPQPPRPHPILIQGHLLFKHRMTGTSKRYGMVVHPIDMDAVDDVFKMIVEHGDDEEERGRKKKKGTEKLWGTAGVTGKNGVVDVDDMGVCLLLGYLTKAAVENHPLLLVLPSVTSSSSESPIYLPFPHIDVCMTEVDLNLPGHFLIRTQPTSTSPTATSPGVEEFRFACDSSRHYREWEDVLRSLTRHAPPRPPFHSLPRSSSPLRQDIGVMGGRESVVDEGEKKTSMWGGLLSRFRRPSNASLPKMHAVVEAGVDGTNGGVRTGRRRDRSAPPPQTSFKSDPTPTALRSRQVYAPSPSVTVDSSDFGPVTPVDSLPSSPAPYHTHAHVNYKNGLNTAAPPMQTQFQQWEEAMRYAYAGWTPQSHVSSPVSPPQSNQQQQQQHYQHHPYSAPLSPSAPTSTITPPTPSPPPLTIITTQAPLLHATGSSVPTPRWANSVSSPSTPTVQMRTYKLGGGGGAGVNGGGGGGGERYGGGSLVWSKEYQRFMSTEVVEDVPRSVLRNGGAS